MDPRYIRYGLILATHDWRLTRWGLCYKHMVGCNALDIKNRAGDIIRTGYSIDKFLKIVLHRQRKIRP